VPKEWILNIATNRKVIYNLEVVEEIKKGILALGA
jgi:hypothetical protein